MTDDPTNTLVENFTNNIETFLTIITSCHWCFEEGEDLPRADP
jgi:hypothetical protein